MAGLRKPKPVPKPTLERRPIGLARTTEELLKRLEEEKRKRAEARKK